MSVSEQREATDSHPRHRGEHRERRYGDRGDRKPLTVVVDDRGMEHALRTFKRLVIKEGLLRDLKRRSYYEKPGDRKRRKQRDALRRRRRQAARSRVRYR
jgi:small subunit ribosomal protein S21